jgi:hypothetical protein
VNQAAGVAAFRRLATSMPQFQDVLSQITDDFEAQLNVLSRIIDLTSIETDSRYEHPYDAALATYILVLEAAGSDLALNAAAIIVEIPRLWWSLHVARQILAVAIRKASTYDREPIYISPAQIGAVPRNTSTSSTEVYLNHYIRWITSHISNVRELNASSPSYPRQTDLDFQWIDQPQQQGFWERSLVPSLFTFRSEVASEAAPNSRELGV